MNTIYNNRVINRVNKEIKECEENGINITYDESNITTLSCTLLGIEGTDYESGKFKLEAIFPNNYPFSPPEIKFKCKMFHPNISMSGLICLDILSNKWSPALSFYKVLLSLQLLLSDPNPDSPLNSKAASLYNTDRDEYKKTCQKYIMEENSKIEKTIVNVINVP
jgi:ubiquitin-protein ligase